MLKTGSVAVFGNLQAAEDDAVTYVPSIFIGSTVGRDACLGFHSSNKNAERSNADIVRRVALSYVEWND